METYLQLIAKSIGLLVVLVSIFIIANELWEQFQTWTMCHDPNILLDRGFICLDNAIHRRYAN